MKPTEIKGFALSEIELKDKYLLNALEKEIHYLLSLDTDRLLAGFRETAGLDGKGVLRYDGWENMLIGGHTMGHYMSACAHGYESPDISREDGQRLYAILKNLLETMKECQMAYGSGFLFGAAVIDSSNMEKQFDNVEEGRANIITEAWVPWYTMHKILEGLVTVASLESKWPWQEKEIACIGNLALEVASYLGDWVYERTARWSEETRRTVLAIEYGGMNDVMYDLYLLTGKETHRLAAAAFDQEELFLQVYRAQKGDNVLNNRHANTTIPKFMGALKRYVATGEEEYLEYAKAFWNMVSDNHTYITGGNSEWEHFGEDGILDEERTNCNCETCNAYNMLKMTRLLYMITGNKIYADWYENTFLNSILSSQNPRTGMTTYFQPMASGYFKVYGQPENRFWCCTGTGMENFTKLGESFYYIKGSRGANQVLIVNQFISSRLRPAEDGPVITQESCIPWGEQTSIRFEKDYEGSLAIRIPSWIAGEMEIVRKGQKISPTDMSGYGVVQGPFAEGETIEIRLPMKVRAYALPDGGHSYGFQYGPVVLSALLGQEDMEETVTGVDVLIPKHRVFDRTLLPSGSEKIRVLQGEVEDFMANIHEHMERCDITGEGQEKELAFRLRDTEANLTFVTHYRQHRERYGIYFRYTRGEEKDGSREKLREKKVLLERYCLDTVQPGYGQYENDTLHNMQEEGTGSVGYTNQGTGRSAKKGGKFSYRMLADTNRTSLMATFHTRDAGKTICVYGGKTLIYEGVIPDAEEEGYTDVIIPISREVLLQECSREEIRGQMRDTLILTFCGKNGDASAGLCNFLYTLAYMP